MEGRGLGKMPPCGLRDWIFRSLGRGQPAQRASALGQCLGGRCCVRLQYLGTGGGPGYFNHEPFDKQWIMWLYTFTWILCFKDSVSQFELQFSCTPPQNDKIASLAPPLCFPTPQILKQPIPTKPLILVCYSNGEILQGHKVGHLLYFWCVEMWVKNARLYFVCLFLFVLLLWENSSPLTAQSV